MSDELANKRGYLAFGIGAVTALLIYTIILWVSYQTRIFVFSYCPNVTPYCLSGDYINSVDEALNMGYELNDIMSVEDGILYFDPPRSNSHCAVKRSFKRKIKCPKYFEVTYINGEKVTFCLVSGDIYKNDSEKHIIIIDYKVVSSDIKIVSLTPLIKW